MKPSTLQVPIRSDKLTLQVLISKQVAHRQTQFQTIDIYETEAFGRVLTLDGHIQLAEIDERTYHEYLVHVPLMSIPHPKTALVVGGGDGGVLRELCKHSTLERIDMAEIDEGVIEESKEHLPFVSAGAFDDPRVTVHVTDAFEFIKRVDCRYDLIVVDSTDVYENEEGGISEQLFTSEFYSDCVRALSGNGFVVTQADNPVFCPYSLEHITAQFSGCFTATGAYFAAIPSFGGFSAYCWGSRGAMISGSYDEERALQLNLSSLSRAGYHFAMVPVHRALP
ncbi:MAG: hypothetical protein P4L46_15830 [Fimbriimonas sp.]|nr:hypothetical protein [Fimbriimonas sp.]